MFWNGVCLRGSAQNQVTAFNLIKAVKMHFLVEAFLQNQQSQMWCKNQMKHVLYSVQVQIICTLYNVFLIYILYIAIHTYINDKIKNNKLIFNKQAFFYHKAAVWKTTFQKFSDAGKFEETLVLCDPWSVFDTICNCKGNRRGSCFSHWCQTQI